MEMQIENIYYEAKRGNPLWKEVSRETYDTVKLAMEAGGAWLSFQPEGGRRAFTSGLPDVERGV